MTESIEVVYKEPGGYHSYLLYHRADGTVLFLRGGPEHGSDPWATITEGSGEASTGGYLHATSATSTGDTEYGLLQVLGIDGALYTPGSEDFDKDNNDIHHVVATGEDLSQAWQAMEDEGKFINASEYEYRVMTQNSNTVVSTLLASAGLFMDPPGNKSLVAWNFTLSNPFDHVPDSYVDSLSAWKVPQSNFYSPYHCPLTIDVGGDGIDYVPLSKSTALFDLDNNGYAQLTAWIGPSDGFLAMDLNGNGKIDNITELFGTNPQYAVSDGFAALARLDSNSDGKIDASDTNFGDILVWRDLNQDGASTPNELSHLSDFGITSISLSHSDSFTMYGGSMLVSGGSATTADGRSLGVSDFWFENNPTVSSITTMPDGFTPPAGSDGVPLLHEFGTVKPWLLAATDDPTLLTMASNAMQVAATGDIVSTRAAVEQILDQWTGAVGGVASASDTLDAKHEHVLEQFMGRPYLYSAGSSHDASFEAQYEQLVDAYTLRFVAQDGYLDPSLSGPLQKLYTSFGIDVPSDIVDTNLSTAVNGFAQAAEHGQIDVGSAALLTRMLFDEFGGVNTADNLSLLGSALSTAGLTQADQDTYRHIVDGYTPIIVPTGGDDVISGSSASGYITGAGGNDHLYGGPNADVLVGGVGDDFIDGGRGTDTYVFAAGDGNDRIVSNQSDDDTNTLEIHGYAPADLRVTETSGDVLIRFQGDPNDSITLLGQNHQNTNGAVDTVHFDDGTTWSYSDLSAHWLAGSPSADTLNGSPLSDVINGQSGDDFIFGNAGDDTIRGGPGDDAMAGGSGSDTYVFAAGDGHDIIDDNRETFPFTTNSKIVFDPGVSSSIAQLEVWKLVRSAITHSGIPI